MLDDDVQIYYKVAAMLVCLIAVVSLVTVYFGNNSRVQYTSWFKKTVNSLVDTALHSANRGDQNVDNVLSLMDFTTALTVMDTLRSIVPDPELQAIVNLNVFETVQILSERQRQVQLLLQQDQHQAPPAAPVKASRQLY